MHECLIGGVHVHDDALNRGPFCGAVLTKKELFDGSIKAVAKYLVDCKFVQKFGLNLQSTLYSMLILGMLICL